MKQKGAPCTRTHTHTHTEEEACVSGAAAQCEQRACETERRPLHTKTHTHTHRRKGVCVVLLCDVNRGLVHQGGAPCTHRAYGKACRVSAAIPKHKAVKATQLRVRIAKAILMCTHKQEHTYLHRTQHTHAHTQHIRTYLCTYTHTNIHIHTFTC